ncbi:MAG: DUF4230 domain-containing protein [Chloroflexia bacterium]
MVDRQIRPVIHETASPGIILARSASDSSGKENLMPEGRDDNQRSFDTSMSGEEGDTVRILPDDSYAPEQEHTATTIQRGTLYTPAAQPQRTFEPYDAQPPSRTRTTPRQTVPAESPHTSEREHRPNQPTVVQVRRGPSACSIIAGTMSLLSLACALLAFAALNSGLDRLSGIGGGWGIPDFGLVTTPTVTLDISRPTVIEQVRALSKLETVHYNLQKVVSGKSTGPLPEFLTSDKILLVAQGEVVAGIDLGKLKNGDITEEGGRVTVRLPEPEILYSKIDNDKTYVYDRQTGIFNKPDPNLETQLRQAAEKEIIQAAMEDGIITKARTNAEQVIRTLITGLGYEEIEFVP